MAASEQEVTRELARYAAGVRFEDLPLEAVRLTRSCILHQLGATMLGSTMPWTQPFHRYIEEYGGRPEGTIANFGTWVAAQDAALVNSTFAAGSGMEDGFQTAPGSAGGVTVPVALALAEKAPISGKEVIGAVALGYDLMWRLQNAMMPSIILRGFHPPSVCGVFVATAVAGRLAGLGEEDMATALGVAASHAAGTLEFDQTGGDVNIMHRGLGARHGIQSVLLTRLGVTSPGAPLEGKRGICHTFADTADWDVLFQGLGQDFKVLDVCFRQYPLGPMEAPLNTFVNLVEDHGVTADQVEEIRFHLSSHFLSHGASIYEPWDRVSAQWSLAFSCGLRLAKGSNDLPLYADPSLWKDEAILGVARKMVAEANPEAEGPRRKLARLQVRLKDGRVLERTQEGPRGSPLDPMSPEELRDRFNRSCASVLPPQRQERVHAMVDGLENVDDVKELPSLLVAG